MKTLDKWDCAFIKLFKGCNSANHVTVDKVKRIWADRCELDLEYCHIEDINQHFLDLANELGLFNKDKYPNRLKNFVFSLKQSENWKYTCVPLEYLNRDTTDFDLILLSRLDSLFSHTLVDDLPGYREYVDNLKK
jgi:hypothetical protein